MSGEVLEVFSEVELLDPTFKMEKNIRRQNSGRGLFLQERLAEKDSRTGKTRMVWESEKSGKAEEKIRQVH